MTRDNDAVRNIIEIALNNADIEAMKTKAIPGYTMSSAMIVEALERAGYVIVPVSQALMPL